MTHILDRVISAIISSPEYRAYVRKKNKKPRTKKTGVCMECLEFCTTITKGRCHACYVKNYWRHHKRNRFKKNKGGLT